MRTEELMLKTKCSPKIAVIGCGYVGLPLFIEFSKVLDDVVGFDVDQGRITALRGGVDCNGEFGDKILLNLTGRLESDVSELMDRDVYIITVPTPVNENNKPDLSCLLSATRLVGEVMKTGTCVVYESTVYPGCIREVCLPLLEQVSGLKVGSDFLLGFSPERINPGDKQHTLSTIVKVVSGIDEKSLVNISNLYKLIVRDVCLSSSIEVAEAAKLLENIQRDVNIALMNEIWSCLTRLDISTDEVLRVASTKWNFIKFHPGLVGGHCIAVDPYYLIEKAQEKGIVLPLVKQARVTNESIIFSLYRRILQILQFPYEGKRVLIKGLSFKPNVTDLRNSKVPALKILLEEVGVLVDVYDPLVSREQAKEAFNIDLSRIEEVSSVDYNLVVSPYDLSITTNP